MNAHTKPHAEPQDAPLYFPTDVTPEKLFQAIGRLRKPLRRRTRRRRNRYRRSGCSGRTCAFSRLDDGRDGVMDREEIDLALHEIQQMVEVSIRAAERLQGLEEDERVSQMPRADHELLDFSLFDLARRVKTSRAMLFEGARPVKPVLSIVRDPA